LLGSGIVLIILFILSIFTWGGLTKERQESLIIPDGPFDASFERLYPDHGQEIEEWFKLTLPPGTTRSDAHRILSSSFSGDITGGNEVLIDGSWQLGGSHETKVILTFGDDGCFREAKVKQHWAYL
jgi:hypothetical protein